MRKSDLISIGELEEKGAILKIQDGNHGEKHPKATDYVDDGVPFIMANNVIRNTVDIEGTAKLPQELADKLRIGFAKNGDVLLTHKGTIGNTAVVRTDLPYLMLTPQVTYYRTDPNKLINRYLEYAFQEPLFQKTMKSLAQQATRPYIGITAQRKLKVRWAPIDEQRCIAIILSAYDDLIENNHRRIQLLEQAARLLYKEWFVHLRFPGHEHVKIKDGVPEGWEKRPLGDVAPLKYGKALKKDDRTPGPYPVYGSSGVVGTHNKALVSGPAIIVGRKGNVGSVYWSEDDFHPIDTVYFVGSEKCNLHLYYALIYTQFINTDVAVPGLNRDFAHSRPLLIPESKILRLFEEIASPIHEQNVRLQRYIRTLEQARDMLLPRLMNGEIPI